MKTIKVIDLLNKIANNDLDTPDYIEFFDRETSKANKMMVCEKNIIYYMDRDALFLNDEVEIIEEEKKKSTLNDIRETYGLPRIEEKKIPEKLNLDTDKLRGKEVVRSIDYLIEDKINEIIDYLREIE